MTTMTAAVLRHHGDRDAIQLEQLPLPQPGPGQVRLRVRACALNWLDVGIRMGPKFGAIPLPLIGGADIAGVVDVLGPGVTGWDTGAEVIVYSLITCGACEFCRRGEPTVCPQHQIIGEHVNGGLAEYTVVPAHNLLPMQDNVGAATWPLSLRALARNGRLVPCGSHSGTTFELDIAQIYHRQLQIRGSNGGTFPFFGTFRAMLKSGLYLVACQFLHHNILYTYWPIQPVCTESPRERTFQDLASVVTLVEAGHLRPVVDRVLPLAQIHEGHRLLEEKEHFGKVVIQIS
jgi:NADPH:quinone reductase-like Zn-dependent oxidoreductase